MAQEIGISKGNIIPSIPYRDAPAAIEWPCEAFGFRKHLIVPGDKGHHGQIELGVEYG